MKKTTFYVFMLFISLLNLNSVLAQRKVIAGVYKNSFVLSWNKIPNAAKYEYILTDNPNCTSGCSGDTREGYTTDTSTLVFPENKNKKYYWKIRPVHSENDSVKYWFDVTSFRTDYPEEEITGDAVSIYPNPAYYELSVKIDWSLLGNTPDLFITIYNSSGLVVQTENSFITKGSSESRYQDYQLNIRNLLPGNYIIEFIDKQKLTIRIKFQKQ